MMDVSLVLLPGSRGKLCLELRVDLQDCPSLSQVKISFSALKMSWGDVSLPSYIIHAWTVAVFCF